MKLTIRESAAIIRNAGGLQSFAKLLDPDRRFESNTVLWWTKRGIPPTIQLEYYDRLRKLRVQLLDK